jgi:hypothetical protein
MFSFRYEFHEESNGFVKMTEATHFPHDVNAYQLPPITTLLAGNLHWLVANRKSDDSCTDLFYILISLLTPCEDALGRWGRAMSAGASSSSGLPPEFSSRQDLKAQVGHQTAHARERLSIEINCPLGNLWPWELLDLVVDLIDD